jgi:tRNA-guanine family transglycosylase
MKTCAKRPPAPWSASAFTATPSAGFRWAKIRVTLLAMLEAAVSPLPEDQPRYLMGVGRPADILQAVARGP